MTFLGPAIAFVFGCAAGSFLNVCIFRLPRNCLSIGKPTFSFCPACGKTIAPYDNIPIVSYLLLRGRCRNCGIRISARYPLIEAMTGALFALFYSRFARQSGDLEIFAVYLVFACALLVATFIDFDFLIIPDSITLGGLAAGIILSAFFPALHKPLSHGPELGGHMAPDLAELVVEAIAPSSAHGRAAAHVESLLRSLAGALAGGMLTYLMGLFGKALFRKEAMGFGDVKLMAMIGSVLGWRIAVAAFFIAPFFGLVMGIASILRSGSHVIPYGPFLSLAAVVALLFKPAVLEYIVSYEMLFRFFVEAVCG